MDHYGFASRMVVAMWEQSVVIIYLLDIDDSNGKNDTIIMFHVQ